MACLNYTLDKIGLNSCADNMGSVSRVWIADRAKFVPKKKSEITDGVILLSDISSAQSAFTAEDFKELAFENNVSTYTETANYTEGVGMSYTSEIQMEFYKMTPAKREALDAISHNRQLIVLVLDNNDVCHFMGFDYGCYVSALVGTTGGAMTEVNNYSLTIQDTTKNLNYIVSSEDTVLAQLLAAAKPIDNN